MRSTLPTVAAAYAPDTVSLAWLLLLPTGLTTSLNLGEVADSKRLPRPPNPHTSRPRGRTRKPEVSTAPNLNYPVPRRTKHLSPPQARTREKTAPIKKS